MDEQLIGQAHPDQIANWKKEFGSVFEVKIDGSVAYFKRASRQTLRAAMSFIDKDKIKFAEVIVENCFIGGDTRFKTDDEYFMALPEILSEFTEKKTAEIKKL